MRSIFFYLVTCGILCLWSCSKNGDPEPVTKPEIKEGYNSFDVPVSSIPLSSDDVANMSADWRYGTTALIDYRVNANYTVDVLWVDKSYSRHISRVSLDGKHVTNIPLPEQVSGGVLLGFESFNDGNAFVIGHTETNSFGQWDTEAWYTAFNASGKQLFSTRIFGEKNQNDMWSKGSPGALGSAVIAYSKQTNALAVYLAHTMKWDDGVRHQGGWMGFLDATTGQLKSMGSDWFYSHNFDQRCLVSSEGKFYTLAHGDAYPRALGIAKWSVRQNPEASLEYYHIPGIRGDNTTYTSIGDFTELTNGNIAIAYSTKNDRDKFALRVAIISGMQGNAPKVESEHWLTENISAHVVWGTKIAQFGEDKIIVGYNTLVGTSATGSYTRILNLDGSPSTEPEKIDDNVFYPNQSFRKTVDGKAIVFVSAGSGSTLRIHTIGMP